MAIIILMPLKIIYKKTLKKAIEYLVINKVF